MGYGNTMVFKKEAAIVSVWAWVWQGAPNLGCFTSRLGAIVAKRTSWSSDNGFPLVWQGLSKAKRDAGARVLGASLW
jgi:hypothetical protein